MAHRSSSDLVIKFWACPHAMEFMADGNMEIVHWWVYNPPRLLLARKPPKKITSFLGKLWGRDTVEMPPLTCLVGRVACCEFCLDEAAREAWTEPLIGPFDAIPTGPSLGAADTKAVDLALEIEQALVVPPETSPQAPPREVITIFGAPDAAVSPPVLAEDGEVPPAVAGEGEIPPVLDEYGMVMGEAGDRDDVEYPPAPLAGTPGGVVESAMRSVETIYRALDPAKAQEMFDGACKAAPYRSDIGPANDQIPWVDCGSPMSPGIIPETILSPRAPEVPCVEVVPEAPKVAESTCVSTPDTEETACSGGRSRA